MCCNLINSFLYLFRYCTKFCIVNSFCSCIVLSPSGAKNITSPPSSCILLPSVHPIFLVIGVTAKLADDVPVSLNILSLPNIIKLLRKVLSPTISVSTLIVPPPLPLVKSLVWFGPIKLTLVYY